MELSYTKEIHQILKAGDNVGFMNQSMRPIEPCRCSSQLIFVERSRDGLVKSMYRIRDTNLQQTVDVAVKGIILYLLKHMRI